MDERRRPLKIGVLLPQAEGRYGGGTAGWREIVEMARLAEAAGVDSLWTIDHLVLIYPDHPPQGCWECWSLLAALAATTERVELGTLVTPTSFRNPALLAKMADTVEEISGGRVILGLGAGWVEQEYRMLGLPYDHRVSRFEEALQIIHGLLREGRVDFHGTYYEVRDCELRPRGPRPAGPPILVGSSGERMLQSVARYADMWNVFFGGTGNRPEGLAPLRAKVDAACEAAGRDPATLARTCAVFVHYDLPGAVGHPNIAQPVEQEAAALAEELHRYAAEGIDHVQVYLDPQTPAALERFQEILTLLDA